MFIFTAPSFKIVKKCFIFIVRCDIQELIFKMSSGSSKRNTRSNKMVSTNILTKSTNSNLLLKSSKLKGRQLKTFMKKKAIGTPELNRRIFLNNLIKSKTKSVIGKYILCNKCVDYKSMLTGPKSLSCCKCELPIHKKCAIANGFKLDKKYFCGQDCMRDDEMIDAGYIFKCFTIHEDIEHICYLSKEDKSKDIVSKFLQSIHGDKFKTSKDYGVSAIHRGSILPADVKILEIMSMKHSNKVLLHFSKKTNKINKSRLKTIEPIRKTSQKNSIVDDEKKSLKTIEPIRKTSQKKFNC